MLFTAGELQSVTEAGTDVVTTVTYAYARVATMTRTEKRLLPGGITTRVNQEQLAYGYNEGAYGANPELMTRITLQRRTYEYTGGTDPNPSDTAVPYTPVQQADYDYYETDWLEGNPQLPGRKGDLRTASTSKS